MNKITSNFLDEIQGYCFSKEEVQEVCQKMVARCLYVKGDEKTLLTQKEAFEIIERHIDSMRRLVLDYPYTNDDLKNKFMKEYKKAHRILKKMDVNNG